MKEHQKSAFLIQIQFRNSHMEGKKWVCTYNHEYPLTLLPNVSQAIAFLSRYTDFAKWENNDIHQMRAALKAVNCWYDITNFKALAKEIMCDDPYGITQTLLDMSNEQLLGIQRLPLGPYKRNLNADLY